MIRVLSPLLSIVVMAGAFGAYRYHRASKPAVASQEARTGAIAPIGVLRSGPSLSPVQIDGILAGYGSPATGSGQDFYDLGVVYGIDPAYALAFFVHESTAGTNPNWDGIKPDGSTTHDIGNISCAGYPTCYGRWRDYPDWRTGIEDWYRLIRDEYIIGRGHQTVDDVIPVYAPAFENDVGGYTNTVNALVAQWRGDQPIDTRSDPSIRASIITLALAQVGKPYIMGTEGPDAFDCSGLIQWVYSQHGIATTRTTFTQLDALPAIDPAHIQPGDMVYFQYPWDQHTGILADVDGDGTWDMIHAGAPSTGVIVTSDVFSDPFYANAIIGYRTAIGD